MLYCPRCRATYKEGTVRFCTNDNTRLVPAPSKQKTTEEPQGIFTNILGENLLFGEDELLQPRANRTVSRPKKRKPTRKPLFAPSFEPPKGSRFFKSDEDAKLDVVDEEKIELDLEEPKTSKEETSFKDVSLAGVVSDPEEVSEIAVEEVAVEKEEVIEEEDSDDLVGQQINNRYKIVEKIGQDEVGAAYLAQDKIALNKKVIVTIYADIEDVESDDNVHEIFGDARELLIQIKHPNIENILDSGELPSGDSFIISEFLEGKPLSNAIEKDKQFDLNRTAQIVRQISYGLNEFHQQGFIYRNLSPESLVLCVSNAGTEQVKILNPAVSGVEANGKVLYYRSPEQIEGNIITIASDTYSLGIVAYLMLTGKMPFEGADADELFENQKKRPKVAASELRPDLPVQIDDILKKALAFNPADRYLQARHFGDAFYDVLLASFEGREYIESIVEEEVKDPTALVSDVDPEIQEEVLDQEEFELTEESDLTKDTKEEAKTELENEDFGEAKYIEDPEYLEEDEGFELADEFTETEKEEEVETSLDSDVFELESSDEDLISFLDEESFTNKSDNLEGEAFKEIEESKAEQLVGQFDEVSSTETEEFESDDDIFETTTISVASFKSGDDQIIELDTDDEDILTEISGSDDISEEINSVEDEIIELDIGGADMPPVASQTSSDIELDLVGLEVPEDIDEEEFELDFNEIDEDKSSAMPLNAAVASVLSDINLDVEDTEDITAPPAETLPDIELNLDNLDETVELPAIQETLPEIEFDLEEIEEETHLKAGEDIVSEKEVRKPEIRIITPEKPYYKSKEIEDVAETFGEEELKPAVIKAGEVESPEDKEIGKKVEGDVEEQRDYGWVLLPLLLLLLLIAAITAFWYFGGQGQDGLIQNTNTPTENNQITSPNQSVNPDQAVTNTDIENENGEVNENTEVADDSLDSNSETDYFGDNFGAPRGGSGGGSGRSTSRNSSGFVGNPKPPPPPRTLTRSPDKVRYKNTKKNTPRKLRQDFLGFTIDYPKDWKKNNSRNNFFDISKNARDGSLLKQFLVTKYDSTGTYEGDQDLFEKLVENSNQDLKTYLPNYEVISEGETIIQEGRWRAYEVKFKGIDASDRRKPTFWGRRFWIPIQRPGMDSGFVITMLVSSLAANVNGIEDVGVDDDLAEILKTFEPTLDN